RLVAYLITRNGPPTVGELREFVRSTLPAYMVPTYFVFLQEFPLTPNGKIDARSLPPPEDMAAAPRLYVAPRNYKERALAEIWQEVLKLRQVGVADDFFELGADSLSATRAFARINRHFGTDIPLRAIFENPTIATLATIVRNASPRPASRPTITRRPSRLVRKAA
ncbi:MAG TPA: phosphopantetheine-binding protein, partial [Verrucomicrobiae bacterium]|nr:phosphopantetheine-binding protein [Verrucomicrobiae bacterium]